MIEDITIKIIICSFMLILTYAIVIFIIKTLE